MKRLMARVIPVFMLCCPGAGGCAVQMPQVDGGVAEEEALLAVSSPTTASAISLSVASPVAIPSSAIDSSTVSSSTVYSSTVYSSTTPASETSTPSPPVIAPASTAEPGLSSPQQWLTQFFQQRLAGVADKVNVIVKTPLSQWPDCDSPLISLSGGTKSWGELSVMVRCGQTKRFVRVNVQAQGNYLVVTRAIPRGATLNSDNVQLRHGQLNPLPPQTLLHPDQIQNAVALRDLSVGQPVQRFLLRQAWRVRAGQQVSVVINAPGFSASSSGQALDNAAVAQPVRVRMPSGLIVSGQVDANGNVVLSE